MPEEPEDAIPLKYRLALIAAGVLWSLGGVFIKLLTRDAQFSALGITFYRSFFAALCLVPLLRGRTLPKLKDSVVAIIVYALLLGLYVSATQGTSAANAIFLQYTAPVYALLFGTLFFKEPFHRADTGALAAAMVGILVLFVGNFQGGAQGPLLMGAGSGVMFGWFLLYLRRMRYADPIAVTATNNAGVAALSGCLLAITNPGELSLLPRAAFVDWSLLPVALLLALMGCLQIALPYVLFSYGLKRVSGVEGSLLALVEPLLNPVWVVLLVGEKPSVATVVGGLIIVAALAARYTVFRPREPESLVSRE